MAIKAAANANELVERALVSMGDLATLPSIAIRIIELAENPKSTASEFQAIIKNDPVLSARVLKTVNAPFYGLPGQIADLERAILLLGLSAIKNLAVVVSVMGLFKGKRISDRFSIGDVWKHSVCVAVAAQNLATRSPHRTTPDEVFLAGIIHDLGLLVEQQAFPEQFSDVVREATEQGVNFVACERSRVGTDHQVLGLGLTTKWRFPRRVRAPVGFHHNPDALSSELRSLGVLMQVADILACEAQIGFYLTAQDGRILPPMLKALELTESDIDDVRAALSEQVAEAIGTFAL